MNIELICMECFEKDKIPNSIFDFSVETGINDLGHYIVQCSNNHKFQVIVQSEKFEILFDLAIEALLDGYTREALTNFASSLERFIEFTIKVILLTKNNNMDLIKSGWKNVKSQSERQLGAYYLIYQNEFGVEAPYLSSKMIQLRNDTVHKGYIPTNNDVTNYGNEVLKITLPILKSLKEVYDEQIRLITMHRLAELTKKHSESGLPQSTLNPFSSLGLTHGDYNYNITLEELIVNSKKDRKLFSRKHQKSEQLKNRVDQLETFFRKISQT